MTAPAPLVGKGRPRTRRRLAAGVAERRGQPRWPPRSPRSAWRRVTLAQWDESRRGAPASSRSASRPAHDWRERRLAPEVWLLCERDLGATPRTKYYLVDLPRTASLKALVQLGASALGDRAAVSRTQGRTRPRSLRRPLVAGLAAPRRADRARLRVAASTNGDVAARGCRRCRSRAP